MNKKRKKINRLVETGHSKGRRPNASGRNKVVGESEDSRTEVSKEEAKEPRNDQSFFTSKHLPGKGETTGTISWHRGIPGFVGGRNANCILNCAGCRGEGRGTTKSRPDIGERIARAIGSHVTGRV